MTQGPDQYFGESVKVYREEKGWSKSEFATRLRTAGLENFHPTTVTRLENGERPTRLNEAAIISRVLGSTIDGLVQFDFVYDYLEDATYAYDRACRLLGLHFKYLKTSIMEASQEEMILQSKIDDGELSADEIDRAKEAIKRWKEMHEGDRMSYWEKNLPDLTEEEVMNFQMESMRERRAELNIRSKSSE